MSRDRNVSCSAVEPIYATREQAWDFIAGGSRKVFEAHYRPHVPEHKRGGRIFYKYSELRQCAENMEAGVLVKTAARGSISSASRITDDAETSQRAKEITQQLKSKQRQSTPKLFPVGGGKAVSDGT